MTDRETLSEYYDARYRGDYMSEHSPLEVERVADVLAAIPAATVTTVLDFGCGRGAWMPTLRRRFPEARITGIDIRRRPSSAPLRSFGTRRSLRSTGPCSLRRLGVRPRLFIPRARARAVARGHRRRDVPRRAALDLCLPPLPQRRLARGAGRVGRGDFDGRACASRTTRRVTCGARRVTSSSRLSAPTASRRSHSSSRISSGEGSSSCSRRGRA